MLKSAHINEGIKGEEMSKFLSLVQASRQLGISRGSIYKYIAEKKLIAKTDEFGDIVRFKFDPEEVIRFGEILKKRRKRGQRLI